MPSEAVCVPRFIVSGERRKIKTLHASGRVPLVKMRVPQPWFLLPILALQALGGCPSTSENAADLAASPQVPGGLFADCSPGEDDPPCQQGLRCSLVQVGDPPYVGFVTQCVPQVATPLAEGAVCSFDQVAMDQPTQGPSKRYDRCGAGAGCGQGKEGLRCTRLCPLRVPGTCDKGALCVVPAQVESVGLCVVPDRCDPVSPQKGCPKGDNGQPLPCYVLTEAKVGTKQPQGGAFCLPRVPLFDSTGELLSRCERSANCQAGLSCVRPEGAFESTCRPYCVRPKADGGMPDGGTVRCAGDLGECRAIAYFEQIGRCF